ncbi:MAG: hypothetical protein AUG49_10310 [Catenulispora sp. 13_1_20CM_3_70_7]|nr:MAG: hypothetical protein AUG49_10310 [Catenulispora sp. 13_1_20CM_3_70_7]
MTDDLPADVTALIDQTRYEETADFPVERGYLWTACASVENGNPLYWDDTAAAEITGGPIAHFDLKAKLGLPEAIISEFTTVFYEPVRPGDVLTTCQRLRSVSPVKTTKLGRGRFWTIDVEYRNTRGDLCGIESYTGFGYRRDQPEEPGEPEEPTA